VTISRSFFVDNGGDLGGGAIAASGASQVTVQQCRFTNNSMSDISGIQRARGIRDSQPTVEEGGAVLVRAIATGGHPDATAAAAGHHTSYCSVDFSQQQQHLDQCATP
jgi:hypothetical protein